MSNAGPYSGKGAQGGKGKWSHSVENKVAADFGSDSRGVEGKGGVAHYSGFVENVGAAQGGSRSCGSEGMGGDGGSDSSFGHGKGDCGGGKGKYIPVWHGTAAEWARAWRTAYGGGSVENQAAAGGGSDSHGMEGKGGGDGGSGRSYGSEGKGGSGGVGLHSYGRKGGKAKGASEEDVAAEVVARIRAAEAVALSSQETARAALQLVVADLQEELRKERETFQQEFGRR